MKPGPALISAFALLLAQSPFPPPRFQPIQPHPFSSGGTLVNAAADYDGDGDIDLFVGFNGTHLLLRNLLPVAEARRSLHIRVVDGRGRATRAGAEVRVYAAGTRRLLAARLVDSGSGYDAQSDVPVHVGLGRDTRVDVEVTWPAAGRRQVTRMRGVDVRVSRVIVVRAP